MLNNREYEEKYSNLNYICGVDEVGRGPLVGPVVASAVILPKNYFIEGLTDSKKLSKKKRDYFYEIIKKDALSIGIGIVDNKKIDEINILEASRLAMKKAINSLSIKPDVILTDAMRLDMGIPEEDIIKGDLKSITISAASVIAKVTRDKMMEELHEKYPMYNFIKNNGYPTKEHIEAIKKYGIIKEHRKSFRPIKDTINN
jgi:ribonuclease HII